ncbi:MAG: hypothetical protein E7001_00495 [Coriobacteriaceae bacterium]|nr:hypothetical protein [Coriobacteriaceae bacterium]
MHEVKLHDDTFKYEARPVFGALSYRVAITGVIVIAFAALIFYAAYIFSVDITLATLAVIVFCALIGFVGAGKYQCLYTTDWVPLVLRDRARPREMASEAPSFLFEERAAFRPKSVLRQHARLQKRESESTPQTSFSDSYAHATQEMEL